METSSTGKGIRLRKLPFEEYEIWRQANPPSRGSNKNNKHVTSALATTAAADLKDDLTTDCLLGDAAAGQLLTC